MRQINQCPDVELDHLELVIEIEFDEIAHRAEAGVVDEHVDLELAFFVSSKSCAPASGCRRSSARYCARMLVKRPSSLQSAMSLSSERATRKTFLPRAASFLAKAAPMPDDAPVMRVVFICSARLRRFSLGKCSSQADPVR